jgi:histone H2A
MSLENIRFDSFIFKLLKTVHPDHGISRDALATINNLVKIIIKDLVAVTNLLLLSSSKTTLSSKEIRYAVNIVFHDYLAKAAIANGEGAVKIYNEGKFQRSKTLTGSQEGKKRKPIAKREIAKLNFPVTRVQHAMMMVSTVSRKSETSAVYMAAVLEYIAGELLKLAGNLAREQKKVRITTRHLKLIILNDEELNHLFRRVELSGGVAPNIHARLLPSTKK